MSRRGLIALVSVLAASAPLAAAAHGAPLAAAAHGAPLAGSGHRTPTVTVSASLTPTAHSSGLTLTITRNGRVAYRKRVGAAGCPRCGTAPVPPGKQAVHVLDLDADGELEVVLGLFSGGANCCFIDQVFSLKRGTPTYVPTQHNFLNAGAALVRIGRRWVLRSGDSRITEAGFTDTADSGTPIQIWRFAKRTFTDVTRRYPTLIRADAAKWMRLFDHHLSNGVGLIAAWAADEDLLGHSALVDSTLRTLAAQDKLHTPLGLPHHSETEFVTQLEKLLHRLGYTK